jgi:hypothetical protein
MVASALMFNTNRVFINIPIAADSVKVIVSFTNNLKHANNIDNTGVPVFDQPPFFQDPVSCFAQIVDVNYRDTISVLAGPHMGENIIGITNGGESVSPNSVEILFYSIPNEVELNINNINPYIWEDGQLEIVNIGYAYNDRLEQLDKNGFRSDIVLGLIPHVYIQNQILDNNGSLVFIGDGEILTTI